MSTACQTNPSVELMKFFGGGQISARRDLLKELGLYKEGMNIDSKGLDIPDDVPIPNTPAVHECCFRLAMYVGYARLSVMEGNFAYPVHLRIVPHVCRELELRVGAMLLFLGSSYNPAKTMEARLDCQAVMRFLKEALDRYEEAGEFVSVRNMLVRYGSLYRSLSSFDQFVIAREDLRNELISSAREKVDFWIRIHTYDHPKKKMVPYWWVS